MPPINPNEVLWDDAGSAIDPGKVVWDEPTDEEKFAKLNKDLEDEALFGQRAFEQSMDLGEKSRTYDEEHPTRLRDITQRLKSKGQVLANLGMGALSFPFGLAAGAGSLIRGEGAEGFRKSQEKVGEFFTPNVGELTPEAQGTLEAVGKVFGAPARAGGAIAAAAGGEDWRAAGEVAGDIALIGLPIFAKRVANQYVGKGLKKNLSDLIERNNKVGLTTEESGAMAESLINQAQGKKFEATGKPLNLWEKWKAKQGFARMGEELRAARESGPAEPFSPEFAGEVAGPKRITGSEAAFSPADVPAGDIVGPLEPYSPKLARGIRRAKAPALPAGQGFELVGQPYDPAKAVQFVQNLRMGAPIAMGNPTGTAHFDYRGRTFESPLPTGTSPIGSKYGPQWALDQIRTGKARPIGGGKEAFVFDDGLPDKAPGSPRTGDLPSVAPTAPVLPPAPGQPQAVRPALPPERGAKREKKAKPGKETGFLQWIKTKGGIFDASLTGEMRQLGQKEGRTVALIRKKTGRSMDELALLAVEDGWLPPGSTGREFLALVTGDISGKKAIKTGAVVPDDTDALNRYYDFVEPEEIGNVKWDDEVRLGPEDYPAPSTTPPPASGAQGGSPAGPGAAPQRPGAGQPPPVPGQPPPSRRMADDKVLRFPNAKAASDYITARRMQKDDTLFEQATDPQTGEVVVRNNNWLREEPKRAGKEEPFTLFEPQWEFGKAIPFGAVEVVHPGDIKRAKPDKTAQGSLFGPEPGKEPPKRKGPEVEQVGMFDKPKAETVRVETKTETKEEPKAEQLSLIEKKDKQLTLEALADLRKVEALPVKGSGIKTLGKGISTELIQKGYVNLTGRKFKDISEAAAMFSVFRNPKFETHRFIFVKKLPDGGYEILGHEGRSSKLPGMVKIFKDDPRNPTRSDPKEWHEIKARIKRIGADGVFSLHNHPSGKVKASKEDEIVATNLRDQIPEYLGSLIIDHDKYNLMMKDKLGMLTPPQEIPLDPKGRDKFITPSKEHNLLGVRIQSPKELAALAQQIELDEKHSVIFFMDSELKVRGAQDVHNGVIQRRDFPGYLRNRAVDFGTQVALVMTKDGSLKSRLEELYKKNVIAEGGVVDAYGIFSMKNTYVADYPQPNIWREKPVGSFKVAQPVVSYGQADPRHIDLNDKLTQQRKDLAKLQRERDALDAKVNRLDKHIGTLKTEQAKKINTELRRRAKLQRVDRERKIIDLTDKIHVTERAISNLAVGPNSIVKRRQMGEKSEGRFAPPVTQREFDVIKALASKEPMRGAYRDWFETGPRMFDHYGKAIKEMIYRPATAARYEAHKETVQTFKDIDQQFSKLPRKSPRRIGIYAIAQQPRGMQLLKEAGIDQVPTLTPEEYATYKWARDILSKTYDRLQAARKVAGQKPFPPVQDYFTFMRNLSFWDRWGLNPATADLNMLPEYEVHLRSTPFRFAKRRVGGSYPVEIDAKFILKNYMKSALTHINVGPEVAKMRELVGRYEIGGKEFLMRDTNPTAYQQITHWIDYVSGTPPQTNLPEIVQKAIKALSRNIVASTLAFSVRFALIQPTSMLQAWSRLGTIPLMKAVPAMFHPSEWRRALEQSHHLSPRIMDIALDRAVEELWGPVSRAKAKAVGAGFYFPRALDYSAANYTWLAAEQAGKKAGLSGAELINFADDITVATQGSGAREDISKIQRTVLGHAAMLFQTFNINQWGFFLRDTLGIKPAEALPKREIFRRVLYFLVGATAINTVYEDILGMPSPLPTPINSYLRAKDEGKTTSQALLQGAFSLVGMVPSMGGMRFGSTMMGAAADWTMDVAKKGAEWGGLKGQYVKPAPEIAMRGMGIPGTSQIFKTVRGLDKGLPPLEAIVGTTKSSTPGKARVKRPLPGPVTRFLGIRSARKPSTRRRADW